MARPDRDAIVVNSRDCMRVLLAGPGGPWALVEVTGHVCNPGYRCESNANPSLGMPTGSETIAKAVAHLHVVDMSPVPCALENGKWYVYLAA